MYRAHPEDWLKSHNNSQGPREGPRHRQAQNRILLLSFVHADFRFLLFMVRNGQVVAIEFGDKNPGLRTEAAGNLGQQTVAVSYTHLTLPTNREV